MVLEKQKKVEKERKYTVEAILSLTINCGIIDCLLIHIKVVQSTFERHKGTKKNNKK